MDPIRNKMAYGDRIFARLTSQGKTVVEFCIECVADLPALLKEIRARVEIKRGLFKLYIRNITRGWTAHQGLLMKPIPPAPVQLTIPFPDL